MILVSGKHPCGRVTTGFLFVQGLQTFDTANNKPHQSKDEHEPADQDGRQYKADKAVQHADPERPDLKLVVTLQPRRCFVPIELGHNETDEAGQAKYHTDQIKNVHKLGGTGIFGINGYFRHQFAPVAGRTDTTKVILF